MRESKFRAWDTADKVMLPSDKVQFFDLLTIVYKVVGNIYEAPEVIETNDNKPSQKIKKEKH